MGKKPPASSVSRAPRTRNEGDLRVAKLEMAGKLANYIPAVKRGCNSAGAIDSNRHPFLRPGARPRIVSKRRCSGRRRAAHLRGLRPSRPARRAPRQKLGGPAAGARRFSSAWFAVWGSPARSAPWSSLELIWPSRSCPSTSASKRGRSRWVPTGSPSARPERGSRCALTVAGSRSLLLPAVPGRSASLHAGANRPSRTPIPHPGGPIDRAVRAVVLAPDD